MGNEHLNPEKSLLSAAEKEFENQIRPAALVDFSGQGQIIDNLKIFIQAARMRGEALDHVLFMVRLVLEKPHFPALLQTRWESVSKKLQDPLLKTWRSCRVTDQPGT
jgi:Holliday junction resolvasome RuvABC ATP-dependent DNA helicase subunit